ncbi:TPA: 30S ribosomal protein S17e [Candidatus Woesearchaeota archaeon]|nr:30S ribosomal protein S17e [Candidatus Woesearchaeota archaeon]
MGRIKTVLIKRTTTKLIESSPNKFSRDFNKNKDSIKELTKGGSKKMRNIIAGYAVRLKRKSEEGPKKKKPSMPPRGFGPQRFRQRSHDYSSD